MSTSTIRQVLETALATISPTISTAYENDVFTPTPETAYQEVFFFFTKPANNYLSRNYDQDGFMQVNLFYPLLGGMGAITTRAELIRAKFKSGSVYSNVRITATPEIGQSNKAGDRIFIPVKVEFSKFITEA